MNNELMKKIVLFLVLVLVMNESFARKFLVSSADELSKLKLIPGDTVIIKEGEWKNQQLRFSGRGTEQKPICLQMQKPGKTLLTGSSTLKIDGEWLVADGLYFTDGYSLKDDVVSFSKTSTHCRLTNSAIVSYNPPDLKQDYKWISVYGHHNRVDHCWLEDKKHQGTTLVIWLDEQPNYHLIDHNYFGPRPAGNNNQHNSVAHPLRCSKVLSPLNAGE